MEIKKCLNCKNEIIDENLYFCNELCEEEYHQYIINYEIERINNVQN